jgi:UDP-glucuronate 4-epimerase
MPDALSERILITGAAGFIGSHLVERLLAGGAAVAAVDNFTDTYDPSAKRRNLAAAIQNRDFTLIEGDIRDAAAMERVVQSFAPQVIIHLAALAGVRPSLERPALYADVNVTGTTVMLEMAVRHQVGKFIFGSSSSVYGNNAQVPFAESHRVDQPISPYAATKRAGELLAHTYHHVHGLAVTCLRFFTVYGPRQRPDLAICKFMRLLAAGRPIPLFGDGSSSRDYTYIDDIVDGILVAVGRCKSFDIVNLGSHRPIALIDLVRTIERVTGVQAAIDWQPPQPGDVERTYADLAHARQTLRYAPKVPLETGLAHQWEWIRGLDMRC